MSAENAKPGGDSVSSVRCKPSIYHPAGSEVCASWGHACLSADLVERIKDDRYSNEWVGIVVRAFIAKKNSSPGGVS